MKYSSSTLPFPAATDGFLYCWATAVAIKHPPFIDLFLDQTFIETIEKLTFPIFFTELNYLETLRNFPKFLIQLSMLLTLLFMLALFIAFLTRIIIDLWTSRTIWSANITNISVAINKIVFTHLLDLGQQKHLLLHYL